MLYFNLLSDFTVGSESIITLRTSKTAVRLNYTNTVSSYGANKNRVNYKDK